MARKFSLPEVAEMEVGETRPVDRPKSEVKRKVGLYGARNGKRFEVGTNPVGQALGTRLPDPEPTSTP